MAADVEHQVVAGDAHQVGRHHAAVIFRGIFAEIGVDSRQTLSHGARTVDASLVNQRHLHVVADPALDFICRAARSHTTTDKQDIGLEFLNGGISECTFAHIFVLLGFPQGETRASSF